MVLGAGLTSRIDRAKAMGWPWDIGGGNNGGGGSGKCFLAGTRILTPHGEVDVGELNAGDLVVVQDGSAKSIKSITTTTLNRPADGKWKSGQLPVRIQRDAFGPNAPHSDLYLSRTHSVLLDGALYPIDALINGNTIAVVDGHNLDTVLYFHIEMETHDIIIAEGAACETLLATETAIPAAPVAVQLAKPGSRLKSHLRSAISPVIDLRNDGDRMRDRLEDRAELLNAA